MAATTMAPQESDETWQERERREQQKAILSGNRVKSRPAKDAVINGILSSLQTLESPRNGTLPNSFFTEDSRHNSLSRPLSPTESFASAPNVPFSPGTTPARPTTAPYVESDDEFDDFAAAPVIPTTRTLGPSPAVRTSSVNGSPLPKARVVSNIAASASPLHKSESRFDTQQEMGTPQSKLAAEGSIRGSPEPRRLRRVTSRDTLRQAQPDKDFQVDQDFILNGLGSLAAIPQPVQDIGPQAPGRSSPKLLGKARLYLEESMEETSLVRQRSNDTDSIRSSSSKKSSVAGPSTPAVRVSRAVSKPSPITDSIPMRTSSLRQASASPASTRRIPRAHQRVARASSMQRTISEDASSDIHWAELGEGDETVKRIMELRKKRETRLLDEDSETATIDTRAGTSPMIRYPTPSPERQRRPPTSTSETTSLRKAYRTLGIDHPHLTSSDHDAHTGSGDGAPNVAARALSTTASTINQSSGTLILRTPASGTISRRPLTAKSTLSIDPPISLDYSYAQAVDALQAAEQELQRREQLLAEQRKQYGMTSVATLRPTSHKRTTSQSSNNASPLRLRKSQRGRSNYSDVAEELGQGRDRRKSMSDAKGNGENGRRDSVEETVLDFLRAPRLSQKIADAQTGRTISFSEVGDPKGAAVFVCVGMGLTRYVTAFFDELASTLRLRLITIDRPGVGESQPYNDRSGPLMWPGDVTAVCEHLGITSFSMLAHSAGAVYALATALILPHMVRGAIHLLAPWIPPSQLEAVPYSTTNQVAAGTLPRGQRFLRVLPTPFLRAANSSWINMGSLQPAKRKTSSSPNGAIPGGKGRTSSESPGHSLPVRPITSSGTRPEVPRRESMMLMDRFVPDTNPMENFAITGDSTMEDKKRRTSLFLSATATPTDPNFEYASIALNAAEHTARERQSDFSSRLTQLTWEYAIKDSNPATDLLVCLERNREIGFRYTDVNRKVIITHGAEDKRVPMGNVKWLAEQMNRAAITRGANTRESLVHDPGNEPGCEVRILQGEGHGLMASPIIMGDILCEISGYWTPEEKGRYL